MSPRNRFPSIEEEGIRLHVEKQGVEWELLMKLYTSGLSNSAIAKVVGKHKETIAAWRPYLEKEADNG